VDPEVPGSEELQQQHVASVAAVEQGHAPHRDGVRGVRGGEEFVPEVLKGLFLGGFEVGDEVGVLFERGGCHEGGECCLL